MSDPNLPATRAEAEALVDVAYGFVVRVGDDQGMPLDLGKLLALARLGASVVGAKKMWIDEYGHMTETPERFDFYVLIVKNVLAGEGDK